MMQRLLTWTLAAATLTLCGCGCGSRPSETKESSPATPPSASSAAALEGSAFNKFFPPGDGGLAVVFTQEKTGLAMAELTRDGKKMAQLSISDTAANPEAKGKFQSTSTTIAGLPAAPVGSQGTALLVADRFQVQVRSLDPSFAAADREAWLKKFQLEGLAGIAK